MTQSLAALMQPWRNEAKAKLNSEEIFLLDHPTVQDQGFRAVLMPYSVKQRATLQALAQDECAQKVMAAVTKIEQKLQLLKAHGTDFEAHKERYQVKILSALAAQGEHFDLEQDADLYQTLRILEINSMVATQGSLGVTATFLQSIAAYLELYPLCYFLHQMGVKGSDFSPEQMSDPVFDGLDEAHKERIALFATVICDFDGFTQSSLELVELVDALLPSSADMKELATPLIGCALLGLDKSLQALHSLKTLQPEASLPELISTLSEFCANDNQDGPALVRFNALVQSSAFARLKAKAQQLKPQLDDFELMDVGPKNKGPLYQAKKELTLTVAADELTALDQGATTPNQAPAHTSAAASSELSFAASGTLSTSWGNPFAAPAPIASAAPAQPSSATPSGAAAPAPSAGANSGLGLSISSSLDAGTMGLSSNAGAGAPRGLNLLNAASTDSAVGLGISNAAGAQVRTAPAASSAPSGLKPEAAAQLSAGSGAASTLVVSSAAQANSAAKKSNARMDSLELTSAVITSEVSGLMSSAAADGLSLSGANKDQLWSAPSRSSVGATAPAPETPKPGLAAGLALTPANAPALAQTTAAVQAHSDTMTATETEHKVSVAETNDEAATRAQAEKPTQPSAAPADTSAESAESAPVDATQASAAQEPATTSVRSASVAAAASGANTGLELTAASQAATISMLSSSFGSGLALTPASTAPEAAASTKAASEPEGAPAAGAQGVKSAEQSAGSLLEPSSTQGAHGLNLQSATGAPGSLSTSTDANLISADASLGLSLAHADRFGLQLTSAAAAQKAARSLEPTDQASLIAGLILTPADAISAIAPQGSASAPAKAAKATTPAAPAQTATASDRSFAVTSARAQSSETSTDAYSADKSVARLTERAKDESTVSVAQQESEASTQRAAGTQADPAQDQASHASAEQSAVSGGASATASSDAGSNALVGALAAASSGDKHSAARDKGGLSLTNAAGDLSVRNSADATQATSSAASLGLSLSPADASTGLKLAAAADNKAPADFAQTAGWSSGLELAPASAESKSHSEAHARAISAPAPSPAHTGSNTDKTTSTAPGSNISPASAASSAAAMGLEPRGARAQSASSITAPKSGTATTSGAGLALTSADSAQNYATETALTVQHGGLELTSATSAASSTAEPNTAAPSAPIAASHQAPAAPQASAQATPVQTGELSLGATSSLARSPAFNALAASTLSQQASAWDLLKPSTSDVGSAELLGIVTAAPTVTTPDSGAGAAVHGTGASANAQVNAESAGSQTSADSAVSDSKTAVASDASATAASRAETAASDAAVAANAPEGSSLEASDNKVASSDCAPASAEHKHGMRAMSAHSDRSQNETVERANSIKHSTGRRHATESQERVWRQSDIGERRAQEAAPERWVSSTVRARYGASSAHARFDERVKIFSRKSDNTTTERTIGDIEQNQKQRLEAEMNSPEFQALRASRAAQYAAAQAAAEAAAAAENSTEPNPPGTAATSTTSGGSTQTASTQAKAPAKKTVRPVKYVAPTLEVTSATTATAEQAPDLTGAGAAVASSSPELAPSEQSAVSSELSLGAASSFDLAFSAAASSTNSWSNFIAPSTDGLTIIGSDNQAAPSPDPAPSAASAPISAADLWHSTVNAVKSAQQAAQARKSAQAAHTPHPGTASAQQRSKDDPPASASEASADKPARSAQRSKPKRARASTQTKASSTASQTNTGVLPPADEAPLALSGVGADTVAAAQTKADNATSADADAQQAASTETPAHIPAATTQAKASEEKAEAVATQDSAAVSVATVSATGSASERTDSETVSAHSTSDTDSAGSSSKRANAAVEGAPSTDDALSGGTVITTGSAESIAQLSPELQEAFAAASAAWDLSGESTESTKRRNKSKSAQTDDSSRSDELDTSGAPELNAASPASDTPDTTCDSSTAEREADEDQVPWLTSDADSKAKASDTTPAEASTEAEESKAKPKRGRKSKAKAASSTDAASENTEANSARTAESGDAEVKAKRRRSPTKAKKQVAETEGLSDIEQKLTSGASGNLNSQERAQINAAAAAALFGGSETSAESAAPSDTASSADSEREMAERVKLGRERRRKAAQGRMVLQELRTVLRTHKRSDQEIPTDEQFDQLCEAEQAKVMVQAKVLLNSLLKELGYRVPPQAKLLAELAQLDPESNASEELSGTPHDEPSSDDARGTEVALQRENQGFTQVAAAYDALAQTDYQPLKLDHAKLEQIAPDFYDHMGDEGVATEELSPEMRAILNKQQDQHALSKLRRFAREVNSELSKQNARANKKQAGLTESEVAAQGVSSKRELTPEEIVRARAQEVRRYIKTGYTEHDHLSAHELKATEVKASALTPDAQRQALQGASAPPKTTRPESQQDSADLLNSAQATLTPEEVDLSWDEGVKAAGSVQAADGTSPRSQRQATSAPELSLEQVLLSRPELIELEYHLLYGNYFRLSQEQYLELLDEPSAQLKAQSQLSPAAACDLVHSDRHQSRLIAELRPFRELNVMRRVLLELSDQQGDEQRLLRLQRGKFNYYLRLLGRNFFLTANARRVKGDLDPDLERLTNLSAQRNDDEVKFVLATILLTGAGLYLKSEASPLADTYRSLNFAPPC